MRINHLLYVVIIAGFIASCQKDISNGKNLLNDEIIAGKVRSGLKYGKMRDIDGNNYKTIQIGTQVWMAENLRVSKYRDGTSITNSTDNTEWGNNNTGAWCNFENNADYDTAYGKLYNWYAVTNTTNGGLAPRGWHIPTSEEINILLDTLSKINSDVLNQLKTTFDWPISGNGSNSSGFSARPSCFRFSAANTGIFPEKGEYAGYWSSTPSTTNAGYAYVLFLESTYYFPPPYDIDYHYGLSVRCIKY